MRLSIILLMTVFLSGCAIYYHNEKGVRVKTNEIKTQFGTIEKARGNYWSELKVWIPYKFNTTEESDGTSD